MDSNTKKFINSLDDEAKDFRVYTLTDKVTASELLTRRQAAVRCYECAPELCPMIVKDIYIEKYIELNDIPSQIHMTITENVHSSLFSSIGLLGTLELFWEILARARYERISKND